MSDEEMALMCERLVQLWEAQLSLGTTQGGGRRYTEHCQQHAEARRLVDEFRARRSEGQEDQSGA